MRKRMRAGRSLPAGNTGIQPSIMNSKLSTVGTCLNVLEPNASSKRQLLFTPVPNKRAKKSQHHLNNLSLRLIDRESLNSEFGAENLEPSTPLQSRNLFSEVARNSLSSCSSLPSLLSLDSAASAPTPYRSPGASTQFSSPHRRFSTPSASRRVPSPAPYTRPLSACPSTSPISPGHTPPHRLSSPTREIHEHASSSKSHPWFTMSPTEVFHDNPFATSSSSFYSHPHPRSSPFSALWRCGDYSSYAGAFIAGPSLPPDNPFAELLFPTPLSVQLAPRVAQGSHIPAHLLFSSSDLAAVTPAAQIASLFNSTQSTMESPEEMKPNTISTTPPRDMEPNTREPFREIDLNTPVRKIHSNTNLDARQRFGENNDGTTRPTRVNELSTATAPSAESAPIAECATQREGEFVPSGGRYLVDASPSQVFTVGSSINSCGSMISSPDDDTDMPIMQELSNLRLSV
eukprot:GEMP01010211.1.p1 GENE.GEMP01010211.1~~GEMP01010211.1.p1  ORF type:complete len:459 (+),score=68.62 GEMP01010211.1:216-1592(+)